MKYRKPDAIVLNEKDNVATALKPLQPGENAVVKMESGNITIQVTNNIPPNHKFAIRDVKSGEHIFKFGEVIGQATINIERGMHVHTQNLVSLHGRGKKESLLTEAGHHDE